MPCSTRLQSDLWKRLYKDYITYSTRGILAYLASHHCFKRMRCNASWHEDSILIWGLTWGGDNIYETATWFWRNREGRPCMSAKKRVVWNETGEEDMESDYKWEYSRKMGIYKIGMWILHLLLKIEPWDSNCGHACQWFLICHKLKGSKHLFQVTIENNMDNYKLGNLMTDCRYCY